MMEEAAGSLSIMSTWLLNLYGSGNCKKDYIWQIEPIFMVFLKFLRYTTAGCYYGYFGREGLG